MEHVVFFPAPDGTPAFRRLATVDDAARFVEHLRNVENVSEASVHTLTEVPLSFKTWYRVEIPNSAEGAEGTANADAAERRTDDDRPGHRELRQRRRQSTDSRRQHRRGRRFLDRLLVPEREFLPPVQIAFAPPTGEPAFFGQSAAEPDRPAAQVLEPAFGSRRERGTGYFVR